MPCPEFTSTYTPTSHDVLSYFLANELVPKIKSDDDVLLWLSDDAPHELQKFEDELQKHTKGRIVVTAVKDVATLIDACPRRRYDLVIVPAIPKGWSKQTIEDMGLEHIKSLLREDGGRLVLGWTARYGVVFFGRVHGRPLQRWYSTHDKVMLESRIELDELCCQLGYRVVQQPHMGYCCDLIDGLGRVDLFGETPPLLFGYVPPTNTAGQLAIQLGTKRLDRSDQPRHVRLQRVLERATTIESLVKENYGEFDLPVMTLARDYFKALNEHEGRLTIARDIDRHCSMLPVFGYLTVRRRRATDDARSGIDMTNIH